MGLERHEGELARVQATHLNNSKFGVEHDKTCFLLSQEQQSLF